MQENNKHRIGWVMIAVLLATAGIADLVTIIPFVGDLVSPVFWAGMTFYLWKTKHGLMNVKILIPEAISFAAELIPFIQAFPTFILATLAIIIVSRFEDTTGISVLKPLSSGQKVRLPSKSAPYYANGVGRVRGEDTEIDMAA